MRTLVPIVAAVALAFPAAAAASTDAVTANDDRRTACASEHKRWYDVHVLRNDVGDGLTVVEVQPPSNGKTRVHHGDVQWKDKKGNGTTWTAYYVEDASGERAFAHFQVKSAEC